MKYYTKEQIKDILKLHTLWLDDNPLGVRANLSGANLSRANLSGANLSRANLSRANLSRANLSRANLSMANLSRANLSRANLSRANLSGANLSRADFSGANLSMANLSRANLSMANLSGANLSGANLSRADFSWVIGNSAQIKTLLIDSYTIVYTKDVLQIGCKNYPIAEWWDFSDKEILAMDGKTALTFWRKYKTLIQNIIEVSPAL